ncbi:MAG: DNA double-strand break repair nuclease NurA [Ktedonobacterales bacterium]
MGREFARRPVARAWAAERVAGVWTFAGDGSQIPPWRDASIPVALVQSALFENPHQPPAPYIKDIEAELLTPGDLTPGAAANKAAHSGQDLVYSAQMVNLRRFELEVRALVARMRHHAARRAEGLGSARVVAFYDGSLIVSFALTMPEVYRERYVAASRLLLSTSAGTRIPLVGYIDTSYARDVVAMLAGLDASGDLAVARGVHDALLWGGALRWGDRTPALYSARYDLEHLGYVSPGDDIAFVYFQAATDRPPARLEFPRWVVDDGQLDGVMEAIVAETIAGTGYPYPIETADAAAVITNSDRAQFYAQFQHFADRAGIGFTFSRKVLSKARRRV